MNAKGSFGRGAALTSVSLAFGVAACSGDDSGLPSQEGSRDPVKGNADPTAAVEAVLGGGTADAVDFFVVYEPDEPRVGTDLAFNPRHRGELWAVLREPYDGRPCNEPTADTPVDAAACAQLEGSVAVIERADTDRPVTALLQDANAWHFMRRPTSIDFGDDETFATCGEHRTGNFDDTPADFMGPTLWSSNPTVFGPHGPGGNGSHLDMLHATPFCMGIAHERDNVYWTFNGQIGAIDRYDFHAPHVAGGEDHSDGEASRWLVRADSKGAVSGELERVRDVPSHLAFDKETNWLYVADTGNGRILRLDTRSGRADGTMPCADPQLDGRITLIAGAHFEEVVGPESSLERPSGLAVRDGALYVTDNATSRIVAFDLSGNEIQSLDTGLPQGSLSGVAFGPDGRLYFADLRTSTVRRIDPR